MGQAIEGFCADRKANKTPKSIVFFLGRENFPAYYGKAPADYKLGKAQIAFDNSQAFDKSITLVSAGSLLGEALSAVEKLEKLGVGVIVVNPSIMNSRPEFSSTAIPGTRVPT